MDEAADVAKQVSHGNPNAVLFILLPQHHGGTDLTVVMDHRRKLEDKLLGRSGARKETVVH